MFAIERFQRFASAAREARELAAFARATRAINQAEDPLAPESGEAERVVAALEAMFIMLAPSAEAIDQAESDFREVLGVMMGPELDEEQGEDLAEGFAEALEDEGLEIRLKTVAEALRRERPFAEQAFKLCAAVVGSTSMDPSDADGFLTDLAEELDVDDERVEVLLAEVEAALRGPE
ncbi:MAG: hypothetical protein HY901_13060 [Deltaproteobacteria bacterium]|nr:hypothetical protein [Deltaproteobacteria bacterium]